MLNPMAFINARKKILIIIAVVFFVVLLVIKTPAQLLVNVVKSAGVPIFVNGVKGSVWQGSAEQLAVPLQDGQYWQLGQVEWQLNGWALLLGRANLNMHSRYQQQRINIELSASPSSIHIGSADIRMPAAIVGQFLPLLPSINGELSVSVTGADIDVKQQQIEALTAELYISSLSVVQEELVYLGDYRLDVAIQQHALVAELNDIEATVGVSGEATVALGGGDYVVDLIVTPSNKTEQSVVNLLQLLAVQQQNGSFNIKQSGRF
jgi:hypothetical protein